MHHLRNFRIPLIAVFATTLTASFVIAPNVFAKRLVQKISFSEESFKKFKFDRVPTKSEWIQALGHLETVLKDYKPVTLTTDRRYYSIESKSPEKNELAKYEMAFLATPQTFVGRMVLGAKKKFELRLRVVRLQNEKRTVGIFIESLPGTDSVHIDIMFDRDSNGGFVGARIYDHANANILMKIGNVDERIMSEAMNIIREIVKYSLSSKNGGHDVS